MHTYHNYLTLFLIAAMLQAAAAPGPACVTAADGTCRIALDALLADNNGPSLTALVLSTTDQGPLVVPNIPTPWQTSGTPYAGAVVLDRKLVKPGEVLHVTGARAAAVASTLW